MSKALDKFYEVFKSRKPVIGMVHLPPLPGSPRYDGESMADIADTAVQEALKLKTAGFSACMLENFGDVMFYKTARPETVASLTYVGKAIRDAVDLPLGVCVLQCDAIAGLAIAQVIDAQFVRAPYYTETYVVDAGIMESCAAEVLRYRKFIGSDALILADVHIKHAYPLLQRPIADAAEDAVHRGLADAVIVTGKKTGGPTNIDDLKSVKAVLADWPVIVGSGMSLKDVDKVMKVADAAIVGTSIKEEGDTERPIDVKRAEALMKAVQECM